MKSSIKVWAQLFGRKLHNTTATENLVGWLKKRFGKSYIETGRGQQWLIGDIQKAGWRRILDTNITEPKFTEKIHFSGLNPRKPDWQAPLQQIDTLATSGRTTRPFILEEGGEVDDQIGVRCAGLISSSWWGRVAAGGQVATPSSQHTRDMGETGMLPVAGAWSVFLGSEHRANSDIKVDSAG